MITTETISLLSIPQETLGGMQRETLQGNLSGKYCGKYLEKYLEKYLVEKRTTPATSRLKLEI